MKLPFKPYHSATRATLAIATGLAVAGCGGWGGDRQSGPEYEMSRQMEDLEVPPDLIATEARAGSRLTAIPARSGIDWSPSGTARTSAWNATNPKWA